MYHTENIKKHLKDALQECDDLFSKNEHVDKDNLKWAMWVVDALKDIEKLEYYCYENKEHRHEMKEHYDNMKEGNPHPHKSY